MTDEVLPEAARAALDQLNARRFELLLSCVGVGGQFTTAQLRKGLAAPLPSLSRDLAALEDGGLIIADPPKSEARQGRPVTYRVPADLGDVFSYLAARIERAVTSARAAAPSDS